MPEQVVNADRVAALGLGRPARFTRRHGRHAAQRARRRHLQPDDPGNVARMQAEIRAAGGVDAGVRAIDDPLGAGPVRATYDVAGQIS